MNTKQSNRVEQAIDEWNKNEEKFLSPSFRDSTPNARFLKEKLIFLDSLYSKYGVAGNEAEKQTLRFLAHERINLERRVYPNLIVRLFRSFLLQPIKNRRSLERSRLDESNKMVILKDAIARAGFGDIENTLAQYLQKNANEFSVPVSYYIKEGEKIDYLLNFSKDQNGQYSFDSYKASLQSSTLPEQKRQQIFEIGEGATIHARQAYNLLAERAILTSYISTDGHVKSAWCKLDFTDRDALGNYKLRQYSPDHNYDLYQSIRELPIKEFTSIEAIQLLLKSLRTGDRAEVTIDIAGKEKKLFIEANPAHKAINIYDNQMNKIGLAEAMGREKKFPVSPKVVIKKSMYQGKKNGASLKN